MRLIAVLFCLVLVGCASVGTNDYKPYKNREKEAYSRADRSVTFSDVRTNFMNYVDTEVAWAGIINDIQFKETERTIQVAFDIDYHTFDWKDHGGGEPYKLPEASEGQFKAGWTVDKPARISYLKTLAKPGYMIIVYGKPWRRVEDTIQLAATAVRPIKAGDYEIVPMVGNAGEEARAEVPSAEIEEPVKQLAPPMNIESEG